MDEVKEALALSEKLLTYQQLIEQILEDKDLELSPRVYRCLLAAYSAIRRDRRTLTGRLTD